MHLFGLPCIRKDEMRSELKNVKKRIDDEDRTRKAAVMGDVVEAAKEHILVNKSFFSM